MPSHIYALQGRWADALECNLEAVAANRAWLANNPHSSDEFVSYCAHDLHFCVYAARVFFPSRGAAPPPSSSY